MSNPNHYPIFLDFIKKFAARGFSDIDKNDPLVIKLETQLEKHRQFFYIGDLLRLKILFTSSGSKRIIGVNPEEMELSTFISRCHPGDQARYGLARAKLIRFGHELFVQQKGVMLISTHFRQLNSQGNYFNLLFQGNAFYNDTPYKTAFTLLVLTDLSEFPIRRNGYHFYSGNDMALFRFPDADLLARGYHFSEREFEILRLISSGMDSDQIAGKLFLSVNTVNTHRRNILKKSGKPSTHDLVIELQENGLL
jgi:DNA-binding CsgD family transcriptional regulator